MDKPKFETSRKVRDAQINFWKDLVYRRTIEWRKALQEDAHNAFFDEPRSTEERRIKTLLVRDIDVAEACIAELIFLNTASECNSTESDIVGIIYKSKTIQNDLQLTKFWHKHTLMLQPTKSIWTD